MDNPSDVLHELAAASRNLAPKERRDFLWSNLSSIERPVRERLRAVAGVEPWLEQATVYVDDPSYRQGAAAAILEFRFSADDDFTVGVSCLIDHARMLVRVVRPGRGERFAELRRRIEQATELRLESLR